MVVGKRGRWPGHVRATRWLWPCVAALLGRARSDCQPWCTFPCAELNGQFEKECSDCVGDEFLCRPATFPASPNALPPTLLTAVRAERSASIPPPEPLGPPGPPCQQIEAAELQQMSLQQRAKVLSQPTLIKGLIDDWPALRRWQNASAFADLFGEHGILGKRVSPLTCGLKSPPHCFGFGKGVDGTSSLVPVREAVAVSEGMHAVVYNGEGGNAEAEEEFLEALRTSGDVGCPSVLERGCSSFVLSLGGGREGVRMANHGMAWIGLVAGAKVWHVAPHDGPRPTNPTCANRDRVEMIEGVTHCVQRVGEVMVVPTAWWHATCNLADFTLGYGGQDSCDLIDCTPPGPSDETPRDYHLRMLFCKDDARDEACHGALGLEMAQNHQAERHSYVQARLKRPWTLASESWAPWVRGAAVMDAAGGIAEL